jgi:hypothetical protein
LSVVPKVPTSSGAGGTGSRRDASPVRSISRQQRRRQRGEHHEAARVVERVLDLRRGAGHDHRAAGRRAATELAQRRGVDTQRVGAQHGVAVPSAPVLERGAYHRRVGQHAAAEAARAGDDPSAPVDHLHEHGAPAEAALQRPGLEQEVGRGGGEPRNLRRPCAQRAVEAVAELIVEPGEHGGAERRDGEHDRRDGGHRDTGLEPHWRRKPTPRTVWISGGSPSLRRR